MENKMRPIIVFITWTASQALGEEKEPTTITLAEDHRCHFTELETKVINTTYLQAAQVKKYEFCLTNILLRCAKYETVMETKWKTENITRTVPKSKCCAGYKDMGGVCVPHCSHHCLNGNCTAPETCSCNSGFSGDRCETAGCSGGRWGEGCSQECQCQHGGFCHPVHGGCSCTPGYRGLRCQSRCESGYFGAGCNQKCDCTSGFLCQHVTGECSPCKPGTYGEQCANTCRCDDSGTELCSHQDGKCFCKPNRFGPLCELSCPFGYFNSTCYTSPINTTSCECSNHLFICDLELGCVCPDGVDCGVQQVSQVLEVAPLSDYQTTSPAVVAVVSVLVIGLVAVILVIIYYRRRMKVLKQDLGNRRVIYMENNQFPVDSHNDLVIQDRPPLDFSQEASRPMYPSIHNTYALRSEPILNNKLTLDSQIFVRNRTEELRREKNTNVAVKPACGAAAAASSCLETIGASPCGEPEPEASSSAAPVDVNLYHSYTKNNVEKAVVAEAIKNNLTVAVEEESGDDDDECQMFKNGCGGN